MSVYLLKKFLEGELSEETVQQIADKNKIAIKFSFNGSEKFYFDNEEITEEKYQSITNKKLHYEFIRPE